MGDLVKRSLELHRRHSWIEALVFYVIIFALLSFMEIAVSVLSEALINTNSATIQQMDHVFGISASGVS